jgi:protein-S-isoprenylcysteine O-methyltransferase Ste14
VTQPYEQPGARLAFSVLVAAFLLGELALRARTTFNRSGTVAERRSLFAVVVFVGAGVVGAFRLAHWDPGSMGAARWPLFVVGLVLMALGIGIRQWAIFVLGRFFTVDVRVHPGQTVVERGPYHWVRHPAYAGLIVFFVGLGLALSNWASLMVLAVVPTVGLLVRIRSEERVLLGALGDDYRRYAAGRARLFPGLW